jgi:hypothetical protein
VTSLNIIIAGMICLSASLVAAHSEPSLANDVLRLAGGWIGSILVIVGTGKLLFVDD